MAKVDPTLVSEMEKGRILKGRGAKRSLGNKKCPQMAMLYHSPPYFANSTFAPGPLNNFLNEALLPGSNISIAIACSHIQSWSHSQALILNLYTLPREQD